MKTVAVHHTFNAPIEAVFEAVTNSARMPSVLGQGIRIISPAVGPDPDGVGAIREVNVWPVWFREEITRFERPHRLDYHIMEVRPHFEHLDGKFLFEAVPGGTRVTWTTTVRFLGPFAGLKAALAGPMTAATFKAVLVAVDKLMPAG